MADEDPYKDDRPPPEPKDAPCDPGTNWAMWLYLAIAIIIVVLIFLAKQDSSILNKFMKLIITILLTGIAISIINRSHNHCKTITVWIAFSIILVINLFLLAIF